MNVEQKQVSHLHASEVNPRIHPEEQIAVLADSLRRHGFSQPILIDGGNTIIAGHGRTEAARLIYNQRGTIPRCEPGCVPVIVAADMTADERKAYLIADNRIGNLSYFDPVLLNAELKSLSEVGINHSIMGFTDSDMARLSEDATRAAFAGIAGDGDDEDEEEVGGYGEDVAVADGLVTFDAELPAMDRQIVYDAIRKSKSATGAEGAGQALALLLIAMDSTV